MSTETVDWGADYAVDMSSGPSAEFTHTYGVTGQHTVRLTVTDASGRSWTVSHPIDVADFQTGPRCDDDHQPVDVGSTTYMQRGTTVTCRWQTDGDFAGTGARAIRWSMTWGDGSPTLGGDGDPSGLTFQHTYNVNGDYVLKGHFTDDHGRDSDSGSASLAVRDCSGPPSAVSCASF